MVDFWPLRLSGLLENEQRLPVVAFKSFLLNSGNCVQVARMTLFPFFYSASFTDTATILGQRPGPR